MMTPDDNAISKLMDRQLEILNQLSEPLPLQFRSDLELELKWITADIERLQYLAISLPWFP